MISTYFDGFMLPVPCLRYVCSNLRRLVKIERRWDSAIEELEAKAAESVGELETSHRKQRRELAQVRSATVNVTCILRT